jgi:hypothetical protein
MIQSSQQTTSKELTVKYKLNIARDVDTDEPDVFILNLPAGWKFNHDPMDISHTYAYDSMKELREDIKSSVEPCDCAECKRMAAK